MAMSMSDGGVGNTNSGDGGREIHVPELRSEQDMRAWKREYNIRLREAEWKKRQDELLMQKQVSWEVEKLEKENRLCAAREAARRKNLEQRVQKKHKQVEREYQEKCRNIEIKKRKEEWEKRRTTEILEHVSSAKQEKQEREGKQDLRKQAIEDQMRKSASLRFEKKLAEQEMNALREQKIKEKEELRRQKEAERAKNLKKDALAEKSARVSNFAQQQLPMRSVLVSMLGGVPASQVNPELNQKREKALAEREEARSKSCAAHIRDLDQYAEEQKARFRNQTERQILSGERSIFS